MNFTGFVGQPCALASPAAKRTASETAVRSANRNMTSSCRVFVGAAFG
jgi:hypothetical protein